MWVAFLAQNSGANPLNSLMALTIGGSDVVQVGKNDATGNNWALRLYGLSDGTNNHTTIQIGEGIPLSTLSYFVLGFAYDQNETTVTLEVYTGNLSSAAATESWIVPQIMAFEGIRVTRGMNFDEFIVATSRAEVIPEPASLALLGLGVTLLLRRPTLTCRIA